MPHVIVSIKKKWWTTPVALIAWVLVRCRILSSQRAARFLGKRGFVYRVGGAERLGKLSKDLAARVERGELSLSDAMSHYEKARCETGSIAMTHERMQLNQLVEEWKRRARRKFRDAEEAPDDEITTAKRSLSLAATCEANCAIALERALGEVGVWPRPIPVTERLPEVGERAIWRHEDDWMTGYRGEDAEDGRTYFIPDELGLRVKIGPPTTHWLPLPPAPQKDVP